MTYKPSGCLYRTLMGEPCYGIARRPNREEAERIAWPTTWITVLNSAVRHGGFEQDCKGGSGA